MKILFLCTAHNSLSQRLYLALSRLHHVTIEYALSEEVMLSAVRLAQPDIIICPFLTTLVPRKIYADHMTLIIHPGPPGDIGPSALDWLLMGDDGTVDDSAHLLQYLDTLLCRPGRSHWGVTVLQAIEEFDAGPVWAYDQFEIDIDRPGLTKSELYRGPVTTAAIAATLAAVARVEAAAMMMMMTNMMMNSGGDTLLPPPPQEALPPLPPPFGQHEYGLLPNNNNNNNNNNNRPAPAPATPFSPNLQADPKFRVLSVGTNTPFQGGGKLHHRPLLKGAQREFDVTRHDSEQISRRIRCGDSQPGVLSRVFGGNLYIYGGMIEDNAVGRPPVVMGKLASKILGVRSKAICIAACDGKGVWITHTRRPKTKYDRALWPKVPALAGLLELGLIKQDDILALYWSPPLDWSLSSFRTYQDVWVDMELDGRARKTVYLYFDFYNGAMSTDDCSHLIAAMDYILTLSTADSPVQAVVLMGGSSYFSNGIALNVIEAAANPATESWLNINRIDDAVYYLLHEFPSRGILTLAGVRGNAAAGGVALAAACDVVIAGAHVVLNPAYRAVGLFGSEFHTLSYYGRCGHLGARKLLRAMTPLCPLQAQAVGLIDYVFPGGGSTTSAEQLDDYIRTHVAFLLRPGILHQGAWKRDVNLSSNALALARAHELGEMSLDFWSPRAVRYHSRRYRFVRKIRGTQTPLRFATHRRKLRGSALEDDEEERDSFDSVEYFRRQTVEQMVSRLRLKMSGEAFQHNQEILLVKGSGGGGGSRQQHQQQHQQQRGSIASIATRDSRDSGIVMMENLEEEEREISTTTTSSSSSSTPSTPSQGDKKLEDVLSSSSSSSENKNLEPIFSCYYTPPPESEIKGFIEPLVDGARTPGETPEPLSPGETVDRFFQMI